MPKVYFSNTNYPANNVVKIQYSTVKDDSDWKDNYNEVFGIDAKTYNVRYRIVKDPNGNWSLTEDSDGVDVTISPADASAEGVGVTAYPQALKNLVYNEQEQDLISFGTLSATLGGDENRGAAVEGCQIVFYYADSETTKYTYYYDTAKGTYVWDHINGKLPGKTAAGTYTLKYYITASETGNYQASAVNSLEVTIAQRSIYWLNKPTAVSGLKILKGKQAILREGTLTDDTQEWKVSNLPQGVKVKYTQDAPEVANRTWQESIPEVSTPDLWYVWYVVEVDGNNKFVGPEDNEQGTRVVVLIERYVLTIRDLPRSKALAYTGENQSLVNYSYLSTDSIEDLGENAPYFEYSLDKVNWGRQVMGKACKEYTVYYRLNYNEKIFDFRGEDDGQETPMELKVSIEAVRLATDSVRAVFNANVEGGELSYEIGTKQEYDEETGEWKDVPMYTEALEEEFKNNIRYYYRRNDRYNPNSAWTLWQNGTTNIKDLGMGTYEFMLRIDGENSNFYDYEQTGNTPYATYTQTEDLKVEVIMKDYNTTAYVRTWIDFTRTTRYEEAEFKYEGWVGKDGKLNVLFEGVDSTGVNNGAVIRIETVNSNYYYVSDVTLSRDNKLSVDVESITTTYNYGLTSEKVVVYLYEIYKIQYDANGGTGYSLTEGWKWHGIDYELAENKYTKVEDGKALIANGWNTAKAGNGDNYHSGSMYYREDASQIFYAKYFKEGEGYYTIKWKIESNDKTYEISRDTGVWFSSTEDTTRPTGLMIEAGEMITLPQVTETENGESLSAIFGGYVLGWYTEEEIPYSIGMKATRNITFVARLNGDINDYVQCKFVNAENVAVNDSGLVGNGAQGYMALSGMDANMIKQYEEGYKKWVDKYGATVLDKSETPDGVITYNLGAKHAENDGETNEMISNWDNFVSMYIILGLGVAATVAALSIYFVVRKKRA